MPATLITPTYLDHKTAIVKPTPVACDPTNGNRIPNGGHLTLEMIAAAGGTVTIAFPNKVDGQTVPPLTYTFTGAQSRMAGGWPVNIYGSEVLVTGSVNTITIVATEA
ncbi:hypothetical protein [Amycolatopsis sp. NPDC059657]|uniref:hypothetical protein n=1 Tax=Amycolatopsis sp. NPDC059657 TaxID=3346899 RepID=UPI00366B620C